MQERDNLASFRVLAYLEELVAEPSFSAGTPGGTQPGGLLGSVVFLMLLPMGGLIDFANGSGWALSPGDARVVLHPIEGFEVR